MSLFGRSELGDTDDPKELVPGDVATLDETANGLRKLSVACQEAYAGVSKLDVGHWTGAAADKFGSYFSAETPKWRDAAEAFGPAVEALTTYKGAVERAQRDAAEAIRIYNESKAETEAAEKQYDAASSQHEKAALDAVFNGDAAPSPLAPFSDPGKAKREQAERLLADARKALKEAAAQTAAVITKSKDKAPEEPGFLSKFAATFEDTFDKTTEQMEKFGDGLGRSLTGLVTLMRATSPFDPYNMAHPGEYAANMMKQASGMVHMVTNPVEAIKGILNVEEWKKDPFAAVGQLVGDIAIGIATDGAGFAGTAEKAVAREAAEAAAREATETAATQIGKHVDDGMPPWTKGDYEPPASHPPSDYNPFPDEPFGPQKTELDDLPSHDRDHDTPDHHEPEQPKHEPDEPPRITEPEQLPQPDKSHFFHLQDLVRQIDYGLHDLPLAEQQAQRELMNSYRQQMRDIMTKHG
ncbi:putative T7SS-secreted protein [Lentzea sp. NPDC006480]|uniref:putative T7SS-secreted protein n=1 Tax=Lentzea sp. NPDC006480 TaxID=3157176 RepID=UPI0033A1E855